MLRSSWPQGLLEEKKQQTNKKVKQNKTNESRASLFFDQANADNRERARARDKKQTNKQTKETNSVGKKT